jgi:ABC-type transport system involved in cytochrome c biogenesis ATPase subunit
MIAGLLPPDSGAIFVHGTDALADPIAAKRLMAWLSDEPMIYDKLSPLEYLDFVAGLWGVPYATARTQGAALLDMLGLAPFGRDRCESLSKGMRQKVALAGALVHDPKLIILDEPLTGLGAGSARIVKTVLRDAFPNVKFAVHGTPQDFEGARDLVSRDKYQFQWWAVSLVDAVPFGGKKRGADSGIDGWRYMASGRSTLARAIVSVKGGGNVSVQMVRDLRGTMERENAEAGLFVTLAAPTRPMVEEAAKAGFFDSPFGGRRHPRLQIITIESLLSGAHPDLPPLAAEVGFRRAEKEDRSEQEQGSLLDHGGLDTPPVASPTRRRGR